jgi:glycosyltransferase involved in cell wall biosynthesis
LKDSIMTQAPRVSIVIPTYNSATYLAPTVESVGAQTFADWQLVLFDDGSSDGTVELAEAVAKGDPRIRVVRGEHGGIAATRNGGYRQTHPETEFVIFLDSDDTWEARALELLVSALDGHPECPAAHGLARSVDPQGKQYEGDDLPDVMRHRRELHDGRLVDLPISAPTSFEAELVLNNATTPGTTLIRRQVFESLGGFEASVVPAEDWDMNLQIARLGGFALVNEVILNWRRYPNSTSSASKRNRRARLGVWRRTLQSSANTPKQRKAAWKTLASEFRSLGAVSRRALMRGQVWPAGKSLILMLLYARVMTQVALERQVNRWRVRNASAPRPSEKTA